MKIGMYTEDEIFNYMTNCEGSMLGRSMYDAVFGKLHALITENEQLKADYGNKAQVERDLLEEENKQLKEKLQQKENIINKSKEHLELKVIRYSNETDYMLDETDLKEIIQILDNKGE